jgi:HEAT repeat protein
MVAQVILEDQVLVEALKEVGVQVTSSQDLINTRVSYSEAIPVLLEFLWKVETYAIKETIVRSLATKGAKGKVEESLLKAFEASLSDESTAARTFRWAIANTLDLIGGKADVDDLVRLLQDPRSARARGLLIMAAAKTKDRKIIALLLEFLDDESLQGFAAAGLGTLRAEEAIQKLKSLAADTKNSWVRREALNALKRIEKRK